MIQVAIGLPVCLLYPRKTMSSGAYGSLTRENFIVSLESVMRVIPVTEPAGDPQTSYARFFARETAALEAWLCLAEPSIEAALTDHIARGRLRVTRWNDEAGAEQRLNFEGHLIAGEYQLEMSLRCLDAVPNVVALDDLRDQVWRVVEACRGKSEDAEPTEVFPEPAFPDPE